MEEEEKKKQYNMGREDWKNVKKMNKIKSQLFGKD